MVQTASVSTQVNIREAKAHLSRLLERVPAGEEIKIAKADKPIARLSAILEQPKRRVPGTDKIVIHPNFDDALPEFDSDYMHPEDPMRTLLR